MGLLIVFNCNKCQDERQESSHILCDSNALARQQRFHQLGL